MMQNKPFFLRYELDTERLVGRNTPPEYAKPRFLGLVYAWLGGVRALLGTLTLARADIKGYLRYNNQVAIIEQMLNDLYDPSGQIEVRPETFRAGVPLGALYEQIEVHAPVGSATQTVTGVEPGTKGKVGYPFENGSDATVYLPSGLGGNDFAEIVLSKVMDYAFFGTRITITRF